eukprot:SAG31_NODE_18_length_35375_cov_22.525315_6_plen_55_part_00
MLRESGSGKDEAGNVVYNMDVLRGGVPQVIVHILPFGLLHRLMAPAAVHCSLEH